MFDDIILGSNVHLGGRDIFGNSDSESNSSDMESEVQRKVQSEQKLLSVEKQSKKQDNDSENKKNPATNLMENSKPHVVQDVEEIINKLSPIIDYNYQEKKKMVQEMIQKLLTDETYSSFIANKNLSEQLKDLSRNYDQYYSNESLSRAFYKNISKHIHPDRNNGSEVAQAISSIINDIFKSE